MKITDNEWMVWSQKPYAETVVNFSVVAQDRGMVVYGSDGEPEASLWMASLSAAMGQRFAEGVTVLDYGCGAGRYANFMSARLREFSYYGVEPPGGNGHGKKSIELAQELFASDARVRFGYIGSEAEEAALATADVVLLGSVFTHLEEETIAGILAKLRRVTDRGGVVVASVFLGPTYELRGGGGAYGLENCYGAVVLEPQQWLRVCAGAGMIAVEVGDFFAHAVYLHRIFALTDGAGTS